MSDNVFLKEVFEREFSRLLASGISKQSAAAQALATAQSVISERSRHQQPITSSTNSIGSANDQNDGVGVSTGNGSFPSSISSISASVAVPSPSDTWDQDKRKGKLAANVYSMSNRRVSAYTPAQSKVVPLMEYEELKVLLSDCERTNDFSPIIRLVGSTFSSAEALNKSFNIPAASSSFSTSIISTRSSSSRDMDVSKVLEETGAFNGDRGSGEKGVGDSAMDVETESVVLSSAQSISSSSSSFTRTDGGESNYRQVGKAAHNVKCNFDRISIDIDRVADVFRLLFSCGHEGSKIEVFTIQFNSLILFLTLTISTVFLLLAVVYVCDNLSMLSISLSILLCVCLSLFFLSSFPVAVSLPLSLAKT